MSDALAVDRLEVSVYTVPTERPEADGTLVWDHTTVIVVEPVLADETTGLGFAYGAVGMATLIRDVLAPAVVGHDHAAVGAHWRRMVRAIRNLGRPGLCSMAIAAVDIALWDTRARVLDVPLHHLLGATRKAVPVYGSGGFTSYDDAQLVAQLRGWAEAGIPRVKMKIGVDRGRRPEEDLRRALMVRKAIGPAVELFVDANGAYDRSQARRLGLRLADEAQVTWFEEPVSSDDLDGLCQLRAALPLDVTAGEYAYRLADFAQLLRAGAVDVLQADASRCAGISEWLRAAAAAEAQQIPLSAHCAPSLHAAVATVPGNLRHIEYFHDHARVDRLLFEGVLDPIEGMLHPSSRPGLGLALRRTDASRYRVG